MRPLRLLGWALLAAAFVAAAAEMVAQAVSHDWGSMAAADVLQILNPDLFEAFRDRVDEMLHPLVWDHAILPLLALPGWLLIGVPGVALVWRFRERTEAGEGASNSYPDTSYEEIVAAADEADAQDTGIPSKYRDLEEYDPTRLPPGEAEADAALDPLDLEQADVVPPARHIPSRGGNDSGGGTGGGGGLNRPF